MSQRGSIFLRAVAACIVAASAGTALSVALADVLGRGLFPWRTFAVGVAACHLLVIVTFTVMGENILEDIVKAVVVIALGLALGFSPRIKMPAVPFASVSAAAFAITANAYMRRIVRNAI